MTEAFLHYIWKFQLFKAEKLTTTNHQTVQVINAGTHNHESGPDFFNAKVKVDNVLWAGQVEIHINASDWFAHNHQTDQAYNNVILHVVWQNNKPALYPNGMEIPCIELAGLVSNHLLQRFEKLERAKTPIPCQGQLSSLDEFKTNMWLDRLAIQRLEQKVNRVEEWMEAANQDLQQAFWIGLCHYWGMKVNAEPMEMVAKSIPLKRLLKLRGNVFQIEALLLGASGFLGASHDNDYAQKLWREFLHQSNKEAIAILPKVMWKTGGVRPSNAPQLRLAQLAALINDVGDIFNEWILNSPEGQLNIPIIKASEFWDTHYNLTKESVNRPKKVGRQLVDTLLINVVTPFLYYYGKQQRLPNFEQKPIQLLNKIGAETNVIVTIWKQNNIFASNALQSQALIELTNNYCKPKKCVTCGIGKQILSR